MRRYRKGIKWKRFYYPRAVPEENWFIQVFITNIFFSINFDHSPVIHFNGRLYGLVYAYKYLRTSMYM